MMKREVRSTVILVGLLTLGLPFYSKGQSLNEDSFEKNEIKANIGLAMFGIGAISYERSLNADLAIGLTGAYNFNEFDSFRAMALTYFRFYPSKKRTSAGFFIEVNAGMVYSEDYLVFDAVITNDFPVKNEDYLSFGAGINLGYKLMVWDSFFAEAFLGIGQEFKEESSITGYPGLGLNVGYRF